MSITLVQKVIARMSRGFVLAFHDIEGKRFEELMEMLEPIRPVPLSELVGRSKSGRSAAGLCTITVDDGVADTVEEIAEVCLRRTWPVTFYLPTGNLESRSGMPFEWWRRVEPLLAGLRLALPECSLDFTHPGAVLEFARSMQRQWHTLPPAAYRPVIEDLVAAVIRETGIPREQLRPAPPIAWARVRELSRTEIIRFESHGVSHTALSAMDDEVLAEELERSRDTVAEHSGRPCRHLAYPFGSAASIGAIAPLLARRYYDSAVTMAPGHVEGANPWLLPRIPLYPSTSRAKAWAKVAFKTSGFTRGDGGRRPLHEELEPAVSRTESTAGSRR